MKGRGLLKRCNLGLWLRVKGSPLSLFFESLIVTASFSLLAFGSLVSSKHCWGVLLASLSIGVEPEKDKGGQADKGDGLH